MKSRPLALLFSCEHGGNHVPPECRPYFVGQQSVLKSHRGWDPGTLTIGKFLARRLRGPLLINNVSRLVVETNRSLDHRRLFSEFTASLPREVRIKLLDKYYHPHRDRIRQTIEKFTRRGKVIHIGVHSFTPSLNGDVRRADIGLLYDPARPLETNFCRRWQENLRKTIPGWRVRRNYPYLGTADGLTTHLRKIFASDYYAGIELEVNQAIVEDPAKLKQLQESLCQSLAATIEQVALGDPT